MNRNAMRAAAEEQTARLRQLREKLVIYPPNSFVGPLEGYDYCNYVDVVASGAHYRRYAAAEAAYIEMTGCAPFHLPDF
jgi:hypothetical protein